MNVICCVCGVEQNVFMRSANIACQSGTRALCQDCTDLYERISSASDLGSVEEEVLELKKKMDQHNSDDEVRAFFSKYSATGSLTDLEKKHEEKKAAQLQENSEFERKKKEIMLTSSPSFEGYRIVEYKGFQNTTVVFKNSFRDSIIKPLQDLGRVFTFEASVMSGSMELIENGEKVAMDMFLEKVVNAGANAVIALDLENTLGNEYVKVQINGTAVCIEKIN
jgi:uncharacterized protein YbjQ (UPF0145 family)